MDLQDKVILVTGGLGFIGSHIVDKLVKNNKVIVVDNESTGKLSNLSNPKHKNLSLIKKDMLLVDFDRLLENVNFVFHLAGMTSVPLSIENPLKCSKDNLYCTVKLINGCKNNNVEKIVFSSSSAIYGDNDNIPLKENEYPSPKSPYASSKISSELMLKAFNEVYGLNYVNLRYFNVFGDRQNMNSQYAAVIPTFVKTLSENKRPVIYGDGKQTRDFVHVRNVVDANLKAAESRYNGTVNVASGKGISINELYRIVSMILDKDIKAKYLPERKGEIKHSVADISNLEKINCRINSQNFEKNLVETINWFKNEGLL